MNLVDFVKLAVEIGQMNLDIIQEFINGQLLVINVLIHTNLVLDHGNFVVKIITKSIIIYRVHSHIIVEVIILTNKVVVLIVGGKMFLFVVSMIIFANFAIDVIQMKFIKKNLVIVFKMKYQVIGIDSTKVVV